MRWPSWINVALGVWLFIAPWSLQYVARPAVANDMILGVLVFIAGLWAATAAGDVTGPAWANVVFGVWLIIAPWVIGYSAMAARAMSNDVIIGIGVLIFSAIRIGTARAVATGTLPPTRMP